MMRRTVWIGLLALGCGGKATTTEDGTPDRDPSADGGPCDEVVWYEDLDGDGYGVLDNSQVGLRCEPPPLHSLKNGDCDDRSSGVHPHAPEVCDGQDNDCDNIVDDDDASVTGQPAYYLDEDGDGYGDGPIVGRACVPPADHALLQGDCEDANPAVHPGISEDLEDGVDNDCDGLVDILGELSGQWTEVTGQSAVPDDPDCLSVWAVQGRARADICPTCDLAFWVDGTFDPAASVLHGEDCPAQDRSFGFALLDDAAGGFYLGLIEPPSGYYYYVRDYGYVLDDQYHLTPVPDVPVSWEDGVLSFEAGWIDNSTYWRGERVYYSDWWGFEGVVE